MIGLDTWRAFVPLHNISRVSVRRPAPSDKIAVIHTVDGKEHEASFCAWEEFQRAAVQLIPVAAGMHLIRFGIDSSDPKEWWLSREPIIAWALCVDGEMRPATPQGVWDGMGWEHDPGPYVEMPDGRVINTWRHGDYASFASVDEMVRQYLKDAGKDPGSWRSAVEVPL